MNTNKNTNEKGATYAQNSAENAGDRLKDAKEAVVGKPEN